MDNKDFENVKKDVKDTYEEVKKEANDTLDNVSKSFNETVNSQDNKRMLAGILALVFGSLGIHKFILGYTKEGIIQIILTVVTCGIGGLIPFVEGIIYLTKTDEEFYQTYQVGRKGWF